MDRTICVAIQKKKDRNKYKKNNYKKLKRKYGWSTKKHTNKGSKDGNKGQGQTIHSNY